MRKGKLSDREGKFILLERVLVGRGWAVRVDRWSIFFVYEVFKRCFLGTMLVVG